MHKKLRNKNPPYHATVEVLVHLAKGVRRYLAFTRDNDADVRHCEGVLRLDGRRSAQGDEDALRGGGAVVDVGAAAVRRGLDDLAAMDQTLLTLIQHTEKHNKTGSQNVSLAHVIKNDYEIMYKSVQLSLGECRSDQNGVKMKTLQ